MLTHNDKDRNLRERVLLASRYSSHAEEHRDSLQELEALVWTAGGDVVGSIIQERAGVEPATFLGSGKVNEAAERVKKEKIDLVVFDHELTPTQNRNLEESWQVKVLDRTGLILDIFARRASTREGKLQVELAQLSYLLPRLMGQWIGFSRLAGGIGTRGPGETKLETDRRQARDRIARLKKELQHVQLQRDLHRKKRQRVPIPMVSLVGYTNAGKSTLMNQLTGAGVFVEDKLFATLDPTVRQVRLPSGRLFLLADTVGFVRKLPHQLIEAFKATFREIDSASLLLHIIDSSQANVEEHVATVESVLQELGLSDKWVLRVFNKMDLRSYVPTWLKEGAPSVSISAKEREGLDQLLQNIDDFLAKTLSKVTLLLPYDDGGSLTEIYRACRVLEKRDVDEGIQVVAEMDSKFIGKYAQYITT